MIRYINICKKYFQLNANNKKYLFNLFISAFFRSITILGIPFFISNIVDFASQGNYKSAMGHVCFLAANYIIYNLAHHWNHVAYAINTNYVYNQLQKNVVQRVATYDDNFSKKLTKSYLVNTVADDVSDLCMFADRMVDAFTHFITVVVTVSILLTVNLPIGMLVLIFNIIYQVVVGKSQKKKDYHLTEQRKSQDKIVEMHAQILDGNKEIRSFDMNDNLNKHFDVTKKKWTKDYFLKRKYWDFNQVIAPLIIYVSKFLAYIIVIIQIINQNMTVGALVLIIGYIDRLETASIKVFNKINQLCNSSVRIDRLYRVLNYKNKNMLTFGKNTEDDIFGHITFENVSFTYENTLSLSYASFKIKSKELTTIVGHSGSGKSTIFRLLLRLYKLDEGNIYIDGISIYDFSNEVYSSNVSIATQRPFIFNMTIKENLSLVNSNHKEQIEACKKVGIHDFIMSLPKKYNTVIKEDATDISGGQKQLIALARTILSKSEILLFDEVTSSLDPNTTKHVMKVY